MLAAACSVDKRVSQILNGHTGTFAKIKIPGRAEEAQVSPCVDQPVKEAVRGFPWSKSAFQSASTDNIPRSKSVSQSVR